MTGPGPEAQSNRAVSTPADASRKKSLVATTAAQALVALLLLLLLPAAGLAQVSSENFDSFVAQIISNTPSTAPPSAWDNWTFGHGPNTAQITLAGVNNGGTFTNGLSNDYAGDQVLFLNYNGRANVTNFFLKSADGSNFKLDSLQVGNNLAGFSTSGTITIYSDGVSVGSATFDLNTSSSSNGITYTYGGDSSGGSARPYGTFAFDGTYRNVDEIDLDFTADSTPIFDNLIVSSAVANSPPTVSSEPAGLSFLQNTEGNVNLAGTTFADGNGDALTVSLAVDAGTFGATVADGSGIGSGVTATRASATLVTLHGAAADINTYLTTASNITYTPPLNAVGSSVATLTISAADGFGGHLASDPTIAIEAVAAAASQTGISTRATGVTADLTVTGCSGLSSVGFVDAPVGVAVQFAFGVLGFQGTGCAGSVTVNVQFSQSIPAGSQLYKCDASSCAVYPGATIDYPNRTVAYTLTDGGSGDTDSVSGQITDPAGPGTLPGVPAQPAWAEALLAMLLGLAGYFTLRRRFPQGAS